MMFRAIVLACFVAAVAARSVEQERFAFNRDAEFVPREDVDAVEVQAKEDPIFTPTDEENNGDEGRHFVFPRVRIFRMPPLFRSSPLFPGFFNPRPSLSSSSSGDEPDDIFSIHDLLGGGIMGGDEDSKRVDVEETSTLATQSPDVAEFVPENPSPPQQPSRRPGFPSLSGMFGDFNRRMQSFEDDISTLFKAFVRLPARPANREPAVPSISTDVLPEDDEEEEPSRPSFGFNLLRPFVRPFGSGGFFGFRSPSDFPGNYKNTTSKTEIVNGTRVMVNETIVKGGDDDSSHFVHFKVIHMMPEADEESDVVPTEQVSASTPTSGTATRDVEQVTEKTEDEVSRKTDASSESSSPSSPPAHDLSHILPEATSEKPADASAPEKFKEEGLNPEDFGYQVGDNEIGKSDVEVVNLPITGDRDDNVPLPSGVDSVPKV